MQQADGVRRCQPSRSCIATAVSSLAQAAIYPAEVKVWLRCFCSLPPLSPLLNKAAGCLHFAFSCWLVHTRGRSLWGRQHHAYYSKPQSFFSPLTPKRLILPCSHVESTQAANRTTSTSIAHVNGWKACSYNTLLGPLCFVITLPSWYGNSLPLILSTMHYHVMHTHTLFYMNNVYA